MRNEGVPSTRLCNLGQACFHFSRFTISKTIVGRFVSDSIENRRGGETERWRNGEVGSDMAVNCQQMTRTSIRSILK